MSKIMIISPKNRTIYNFRGDLIKELISDGHEVLVTGPNYIDLTKIKKLGARFFWVPLNKNGINPISDYRYMKRLTRLLKQEKPDIVLSYTVKPVIYGSIAAKKANVKNIYAMITGVGYLFSGSTIKAKLLRRVAFILYKRALKVSNNVIFQNRDDAQDFIRNGLVSRDKVRLVNGSGVNMKHYARAPYPNQLTFFMLSRIMYSKGVHEYLKAAKIIKEKHPQVRFMLLGAIENIQDSIPFDVLKDYLDQGIVDYFGETGDVREYYKASSVYVLPSYREGIPRTVLEAMSMGRPIITTDTPGCRETVVHNKSGLLVPPQDVGALVEAMESFKDSPNSINEFGNESYKLCEEKFNVHKVNATMKKHINISNPKE